MVGELERMKARYRRLLEVSSQLNSTFDLEILLSNILQAAVELTNTEAASILLVDEQTGVLHFEAVSGEVDLSTLKQFQISTNQSVAGWVVTHNAYQLVQDVRSDPRWRSTVDEKVGFTTHDMLVIPLAMREKAIGALQAINKQDDQAWSDEDIEILMAFGVQAAVAIENTRLFNAMRREIVHLKIEIDESKRKDQADKIKKSDFYQSLKEKARLMREQQDE